MYYGCWLFCRCSTRGCVRNPRKVGGIRAYLRLRNALSLVEDGTEAANASATLRREFDCSAYKPD